MLAAVRQHMIGLGWCRTLINRRIDRVKRVFRWAASEELVSVAVCEALRTLTAVTNPRVKEFIEQSICDFAELVAGQALKFRLFPPLVPDLITTAGDLVDLANAAAAFRTAKSALNINPIRDKLADPATFIPDRVARSGIKLRLAVVSLESGTLRHVTEAGLIPGYPLTTR